MRSRSSPAFLAAALAVVCGAGYCGYRLGLEARSGAGPPVVQERLQPPPSLENAARRTEAVAGADASPIAADREAEHRLAMLRLAPGDLLRAIGQLQSQPPLPSRDRELCLLLELLARHQPEVAMELAGREERRAMRTRVVAHVVAGWMLHDPAAALAWVARAGQPEYAEAAFAELARLEPHHAWQLAERLPADEPGFRWNAFRALVEGRLLEGRFPEAQAWVERAAEPDLRLFLAAGLADTWARYQPEEAARWAVTLPEGGERGQIFVNVGSIWGAHAPLEAAKFAAGLPDGESRRQMLAHVLLEWVAKDLGAASRWVNELNPHPENDAAVAMIATHADLVAANPEVALSWAESLAVSDSRLHAIRTIVGQWAARDDAAARRYLEVTPGLGPRERMHLLSALDDAAPLD